MKKRSHRTTGQMHVLRPILLPILIVFIYPPQLILHIRLGVDGHWKEQFEWVQKGQSYW